MNQKAQIARSRLELVSCYRSVFLKEGQLLQAARPIFRDLSAFCGTSKIGLPVDDHGRADPLALAMRQGRIDVINHINARLSEDVEELIRIIGE